MNVVHLKKKVYCMHEGKAKREHGKYYQKVTFLISLHSKIFAPIFSLFGSRQLDDPLWSTICLINKTRESASSNSVMLVI